MVGATQERLPWVCAQRIINPDGVASPPRCEAARIARLVNEWAVVRSPQNLREYIYCRREVVWWVALLPMSTSHNERRFPRRELSEEMKQTLLKKFGGNCAFCGASHLPLTIAHILPLAFGGSNDESNLLLLCPNCARWSDSARPHEAEFIHYLARLLESTSEFSSVEIEPLLTAGVRNLRADLRAKRGEGIHLKSVLIECKSLSGFSFAQLERTIEQLKRYGEVAKPDELVLAFPGRLHPSDVERLKEASISVWDVDFIGTTFRKAIAANAHPYFQALFQAIAGKQLQSEEAELIEKLKACQPGRTDWPVYERLIGQILEHLFCPPLAAPISQSSDEAEVNRRDYILPNYADAGFWRFIRETYSADYIVVDAKNSANEVGKGDALQIANYLKEYGAGLFGIIICRIDPDAGCDHTIREQWAHSRKMVLVINDADVEKMLLARSSGGRAEELLSSKLQEFRLSM